MKMRLCLPAVAVLSLGAFVSCKPKEGKGFTPGQNDGSGGPAAAGGAGNSGAAAGGGSGTADASAAGGGQAAGGGGADTSTSAGGGQPAAPPATRTLDEPQKKDPNQGLPEKSALPKNLEPEKKKDPQ